MKGYSTKDVATMLSMPERQIRSLARAGVLEPDRGSRGEFRFNFRDLVLLRTAKGLRDRNIPTSKISRALTKLKQQLPVGRPLSAVQIGAAGDEVVVRNGPEAWNPMTGQRVFGFEVSDLAREVAPLPPKRREDELDGDDPFDARDWFEIGLELESDDSETAREAYRRCLELDPAHPEAHVNIGRLLHELGEIEPAATHYKLALERKPDDPVATYNLGVAYEDLGFRARAKECYRRVLRLDAAHADAHYNLARLFEKEGDTQATLRHLNAYRKLTRKK